MTKTLLVTRPNHDIITSYLHDFSKEIIKTLKESGDIHVTNLESSDAIRINVEKSLIKENPGLVFLNGHGDRKRVSGHHNEIILDSKNISLTKNKIVYALSCDSLEELGQCAVDNGTKAYIGYKAKFMLIYDPSRIANPSKDKNALPFKQACCTLINALVFGIPVNESIDRTKKEYRESIRSYGTSEDDPYGDAPLIRFALAWNLEFLDMYGDPTSRF